MRLSAHALGLLMLLGGAWLALAARAYPDLPNQAYGAATFPFVVGLAMAGLGVAMLWGAFREPGRSGPILTLAGWGRDAGSWMRLTLTVALVAAYVALAPSLGFLLAGGGLLLGLLLVFRVAPLLAIAVTPPAILAVAWAFGTLLRVPLPRSALLAGWW